MLALDVYMHMMKIGWRKVKDEEKKEEEDTTITLQTPVRCNNCGFEGLPIKVGFNGMYEISCRNCGSLKIVKKMKNDVTFSSENREGN
jgi:predicted Zn-ribbon and HTH transcriptional regulator